jgi:hypothetical protein
VIYGEVGIGIKCWDTFDDSSNKCGVYSIELIADGVRVFSFRADRFAYSESRYINAHIDYAARITSGSIFTGFTYNRETGCQCTTGMYGGEC